MEKLNKGNKIEKERKKMTEERSGKTRNDGWEETILMKPSVAQFN